MNASDRRELARVGAMIQSGDRAGALALVRALRTPKRAQRGPPPEQLVLALVLSLPFHCERLGAESMRVRDCLVRRSRVWPSGKGRGAAAPEATVCVGCQVGMVWAVRLPSFKPPPSTIPPEVLPHMQRMAKRARALAGLEDGEPVRLDPLVEAARVTPDDGGLDYAT